MRYFQSWPNSLAPLTDFQTMAALSVPPAESHCGLWGQNGPTFEASNKKGGIEMARTSKTHPLEIAAVRANPEYGRIGITFCPGKHDDLAMTGTWARDLSVDIDVIAEWTR